VLAGTSTVTNINLYNSAVTNLSSDLNKYRWTISKGSCEDIDDIEIINNEYFVSATVSGPSDICEDYTTVLGNSPPIGGTGAWSIFFGSGIFANSNDQSTLVSGLALGENILRWTITKDGCSNYDDITINRNTVFANAGEDQNLCDDYTTLTANELIDNNTGEWTIISGDGTIDDPTNNIADVYELSVSVNTFLWTVNGNGCEDSDEVIVVNNSFFTSAGSNQQICSSGTDLTASDPSPGWGYWEVISGNGIFSDPSNFLTEVSGITDVSTNIYRWYAFKNGCSDYDDVTIQNNLVTADAGIDFPICTDNTTLAGNSPLPGTGIWTVQVGGGVVENGNQYNSPINGLSLNENIIRWEITNLTCIDYDEVTITNNTVTATAGSDQETCENSTQLFGQEPPIGGTGLWEIVSGYCEFSDESLYNTQVSNLNSGFNTFKWTVFNNGCDSGGDEVTINNKSFDAYAGSDQVLDDFVTSTFMTASLPAGGTGTWMLLAGGGNIVTIDDPLSEVTDLPTGINVFQWTVNYNGCSSYDDVSITTLNFEAEAGTDKTICSDSTKLNAQDAGSDQEVYEPTDAGGTPQMWSVVQGGGDFEDPYQFDTWIHNAPEGVNIYRWSVTVNGATAYDDVTIIRVNSNAGEDQLICDNFVILEGNIPQYSNGYWSLVGGSGTIITPTLYNSEVINLGISENLFQWTISTNDCSVYDYVIIDNDHIIADAGSDQEVYEPTVNLNAYLPPDADVYWSVVNGNGIFEDNTDPNTEVTELYEGNNIFRWNVSNVNCENYDDVTITYIIENSINSFEYDYKVFPNPAEDILHIQTKSIKNYSLTIFAIVGKTVFNESVINTETFNINLSTYAKGTYFININDINSNSIIKIVKK